MFACVSVLRNIIQLKWQNILNGLNDKKVLQVRIYKTNGK